MTHCDRWSYRVVLLGLGTLMMASCMSTRDKLREGAPDDAFDALETPHFFSRDRVLLDQPRFFFAASIHVDHIPRDRSQDVIDIACHFCVTFLCYLRNVIAAASAGDIIPSSLFF